MSKPTDTRLDRALLVSTSELPPVKGVGPSGAVHEGLMAQGEFRFRPKRLSAAELEGALRVAFDHDGRVLGPFEVLDVTATGLGVRFVLDLSLPPGSRLDDVSLTLSDRVVWRGQATTVYQIGPPTERMGIRFTSGLFDLDSARVSLSHVEGRLARVMDQQRDQAQSLPAAWRAGITEIRRHHAAAKTMFDDLERQTQQGEWWREPYDTDSLIRNAVDQWWPPLKQLIETLDQMSGRLSAEAAEEARAFATSEIYPLLYNCPMHSRAFEKPRGYAGDYRLMILYHATHFEGPTLYARFLHCVAQQYSFARTVPARIIQMRQIMEELVAQGRPLKFLTLASGPALEYQQLIRSVDRLDAPVEVVLMDQDAEALAYCHDTINRLLIECHHGAFPLTLNCLNFSVRQAIRPKDEAEKAVVTKVLSGVDLACASGLFDYLPDRAALSLLQTIWDGLNSGGRLFVGNLERRADSSWMMEYVLSWFCVYRGAEDMMRLGAQLDPAPASLRVVPDPFGNCHFLDAVKP